MLTLKGLGHVFLPLKTKDNGVDQGLNVLVARKQHVGTAWRLVTIHTPRSGRRWLVWSLGSVRDICSGVVGVAK
jgi:hypothetical protein